MSGDALLDHIVGADEQPSPSLGEGIFVRSVPGGAPTWLVSTQAQLNATDAAGVIHFKSSPTTVTGRFCSVSAHSETNCSRYEV